MSESGTRKPQSRTYNQQYYAKYREILLAKQRVTYHERRVILIALYGTRCTCCCESNQVFLEFDHVQNDGALECCRPNYRLATVDVVWREFKKFGVQKERYQILCANCHTAKTKLGYCDHSQHRPTITSLESCSMEHSSCQLTLN